METDRIKYSALVEMVTEQIAHGQEPNIEWIDQISRIRSQYPEWAPPTPPPPPPPEKPKAAAPTNPGERPRIIIDEDMERIAKEVLAVWGQRFCVFQSSGYLVELQLDGNKSLKYLTREVDSPRMMPINSVRARSLAARECRFGKKKTTKDGSVIVDEQLPPDWLGPAIATRIDFPNVPVFAALAQAPTLRRDGAVICEPGYDASTGIFLTSDLKVYVPENPTHEDAQRCAALLVDLLCDFEFTNTAAKSVWLAALLSVVCRHTFNGPAPLFIFDAAKRGAGKTRMADMVSYISTGRSAPRMVYVHNDIEMDKRITSLGLAGDQLVLLDNVVGKLSSPSLDLALTCDTYKGRVLQKSEMTASMSMKMVWFATGNGMSLGADTSRRSLLARIEPSVEHPEFRDGPRPDEKWKYKLPEYCNLHRAELLGYALTIVAAYIRAGRPKPNLVGCTGSFEMGSFEQWGATIRNAIVWAGLEDPCNTIKDAQEADVDDIAQRRMIECWPVGEDIEISTNELVERATVSLLEPTPDATKKAWRDALLGWLPAKGGALLPTARDLGYTLRSVKGAIIGDFKLVAGEHGNRGTLWKKTRATAKIIKFPIENAKEDLQK